MADRDGGPSVTTILLVHGTGVRRLAYEDMAGRFAARLSKIRPSWSVAPCCWGEVHGARLHRAGASVPTADDADAELVLWGALEQDPLYELGLLASGPQPPSNLAPDAVSPSEMVVERAEALGDELESTLAGIGLSESFDSAVRIVLNSEECRQALLREQDLGDALTAALARSFTAQAVMIAEGALGGPLPLDGESRERLVGAIVAALGGSDRGVGGAVGKFLLNGLLRLGAKQAERHRRTMMNLATPGAGDVLCYLARGARIREFIAERILSIDGPVVIVAHSLGGIASLDLLATTSLPSVELLVTVGSQAPLLYELNALPALEFGASLPATVPRWVNVCDPRDLLGNVGAGIFPGRIEDFIVDNKATFPRSHSGYFGNDQFYSVLDEVLPGDA
jgi:hypothetical protein